MIERTGMSSKGVFVTKWLLLIVCVASIFTLFHLVASINDEENIQRFHTARNPKFRLSNMKKNNTVVAPGAVSAASSGTPLHPDVCVFFSNENTEHSVHIFYYPWYGNPEFDNGNFYHWNHKFLPHWDPAVSKQYPTGFHLPPADIGSSFYPLLGPYSSRDPAVIEKHVKWMSSAGIDVVVVSWYPPKIADEQGHPWDDLIPLLLNVTEKYRMKLSFHMEPYKNRDAESLREDIEYIIDRYGNHSALFRMRPKSRILDDKRRRKIVNEDKFDCLPLLYFYDSYLIPVEEWTKLTKRTGKYTVRGSKYDVLFVGLLVTSEDKHSLISAGFDGMYTYFAAEGFSFGSSPSNWPSLSAFCRKNGLLFIPSVGPGYDDRRVRPWNEANYKDRKNGEYYAEMFKMAHTARANIITITSFNEWHEGTQIEPAVPFTDNTTGFVYSTYAQGPEQYLHQTLDMIKKYFTPLNWIAPEKIVNVI